MRTLFLFEKIHDSAGHSLLRFGAMCLCVLLLGLNSSVAHSAIVNNNHLFNKVAELHAKVEALAKAHKKTLTDIEAPTFSDRLPIHLYAKSIDIYDQLRRLDPELGLAPMSLPNKTLRPRDVMNPLNQINQVLDQLLAKKMVLLAVPESQVPLGKSAADVYQQLWWLTTMLSQLVPPPSASETLVQLKAVSLEIDQIAKALKQEPSAPMSVVVEGKIPRDVLLVLYQDMHLLGRWQRQTNVESMAPGALHSGVLSMADVYDTTRSFLADLHRMKTSMSITTDMKTPEPNSSASVDALYTEAKVIHDQLRSLTDPK
jgi:hypothetical protein